MKIQSGDFHANANYDGWELHKCTNTCYYKFPKQFDTEFNSLPTVLVSLQAFDIEGNHITRVAIFPENITNSGFNIVYKNWGDSKIWMLAGNWLAYGV